MVCIKICCLHCRKVVLATNIAETSITINDIVYVINGGKAKEKTYDALNKIACLFPTWISKASCKQRRGRAGRVKPGVCYHMFPKAMHEHHFIDHQLPEIMRTPLEQLCLQIKSLRLGGEQIYSIYTAFCGLLFSVSRQLHSKVKLICSQCAT